jgi:hypothetical protein
MPQCTILAQQLKKENMQHTKLKQGIFYSFQYLSGMS